MAAQEMFFFVTGLFLAFLPGMSTTSLQNVSSSCYSYTSTGNNFVIGCKDSCPLQAQCKGMSGVATCIQREDCKYLLQSGTVIYQTWQNSSGQLIASVEACISCTIPGCDVCTGGINGTIVCSSCGKHWESNGIGGCQFTGGLFDVLTYIGLTIILIVLVWILTELAVAECATVRNFNGLTLGLIMRRRAQLFRSVTEAGAVVHKRFSLFTSLHSASADALMGPGLVLHMNWFIFMIILGSWLAIGASVFAHSSADEPTFLDPCRQLSRVAQGWTFRVPFPQRDNSDGKPLGWALWNYLGATLLTMAFLFCQQRLWTKMVEETQYPSLLSYCVMFSNVPPDITDKDVFVNALEDWMSKMHLGNSGIANVSIAFDIPHHHHGFVDKLIDKHLELVAQKVMPHELGEEGSQADAGDPVSKIESKWFFWIQFIALLIFQTPFRKPYQTTSKQTRVVPDIPEIHCEKSADCSDENESLSAAEAKNFLRNLKGSGTIYVLMHSEALAQAVIGMGAISLETVSPTPVTVSKAIAEPAMINWLDHRRVSILWRILKGVAIAIILAISLSIWLCIVGLFLSFELATKNYSGVSKGVAGFFVGLLVPIGNEAIGGIIDLLMEHWGFWSKDALRLWRHILTVLFNGASNIAFIYLVYKKVYATTSARWGFDDFFRLVFNLTPIGVNPYTVQFQEEVTAILWPPGLIVPIFTIPLLSDFVPFLIGRLRVKCDSMMPLSEAVRLLKPHPVDPLGKDMDMLINVFVIAFAFWVSPGRYLLTLWIAYILWTLIVYLNTRMNVLRWQGCTYFGGKQTHLCQAFLMSLPLGFFCAAVDSEMHPATRSGLTGFLLHVIGHFIFVKFVLEKLEPPKRRFGTSLAAMMADPSAPVATYQNTNPIEVLRRFYTPELEREMNPLVFFREDKWYLQQHQAHFAYEDRAAEGVNGMWSVTKVEARSLAADVARDVVDTGTYMASKVRSLRPSQIGIPFASETGILQMPPACLEDEVNEKD